MSGSEKPDIHFKPKIHPILAQFPPHLKDPRNYEKIQRELLNAGATKHSHAEVIEWAGCKDCQGREWNRKEVMVRLGFKSGTHYLVWRRIMETIKSRVPLRKYNT